MRSLKTTVGAGIAVVALGAVASCGSSKASSTKATAGPAAAASTATSDPGGSSGGYGYGGSKTPLTSAPSPATSAASSSGGTATVSVAANPTTKTNILVGPNGHTLYLLDVEKGITSSCTGGCAAVWPALTATATTAGAGVDTAGLSVTTGQVADQVVYKGHLLYYFVNDKAAGDVMGTSIPHWYPIAPDGTKIDKS